MKIAAHITSYLREKETSELVEILLGIKPEISKIYLVDNSEGKINYSLSHPKVKIKYLDKNHGTSGAINESIQQAIEDKIDWLWLFDDDSRPNNDSLTCLIEAIKTIDSNDTIIITIPYITENIIDGCYTMHFPYRVSNSQIIRVQIEEEDFKRGYVYCDLVITSGSLLNINLLKTCDIRMSEELFLDCADYEFCYLLRKKNFKIACVLNAYFRHCFGIPRIFFKKKISSYSHERYRSIIRNHSVFYRYYLKANLSSMFIMVFWIMLAAFFESLVAKDFRLKHLRACLKGLSEIKELAQKLEPRYS
jgi:rhamnosyltransferase